MPEDMENFIHQELGKDIWGWRAIVEESKGEKIILETNYSKGTGVTKLARRYLSHTTVQELLTHFNITRHGDTVTYQIWLVKEIKRMKSTPGLTSIKDEEKVKKERVNKEPKRPSREKQTHMKKEIVKQEQVERKPDPKGKKNRFLRFRRRCRDHFRGICNNMFKDYLANCWIKELSERESPDLPSTPELFNQICKWNISTDWYSFWKAG